MDKDQALSTLLAEALTLAAFEGWGESMMKNACEQAAISESEYIRACPNGPIDLIRFWMNSTDEAMETFAKEADLDTLKVRERIKQLILFRLEHFSRHREAVRKACFTLALPWNAATNIELLGQTIGRMWRLAGDTSNDYNWHTKRLLLSGIYTSTLMCWFSDESDDFIDTKAFLDRRIENVMTVGSFIGRTIKKAS